MATNKRLRLSVLLLALVAAAASWGAVAQSGQYLEGTFFVDVVADPGGPPPFKIIRTLTRHGGVTGPSASLSGSSAVGEWIRLGNGAFAVVNYWFNYGPSGSVVGTTKVTNTIYLNQGGRTFDGRFLLQVFDRAGNLLRSGRGSVHGERITVEPLVE